MKPHFGQSDAVMNKLAGIMPEPLTKGHFGHEYGCDCAVCESMDLRVLYLKRKAADLEAIKELAYREGYNAAVYFAGGLISEQKPKELTSALAELVWRLKL